MVNQSGQSVSRIFVMDWLLRIEKLAAETINPKRYQRKELTVVFLDADAAQKLNRQFRKRDYASDVLSFQGMDEETLGDLVICVDVIKRQAKEHGLKIHEELGYMILHGFLHLLGYDHETNERDAKKMFALQDKLFEKLLANPQAAKGAVKMAAPKKSWKSVLSEGVEKVPRNQSAAQLKISEAKTPVSPRLKKKKKRKTAKPKSSRKLASKT